MGKIDLAISLLKEIIAPPPPPPPLPPISTSVVTGSDKKDDDENNKMIIEEEEEEEEDGYTYDSNGEEESDDYDVDDEDLRDRLDFFEGVSEEDYANWINESNLEKKMNRMRRIEAKQKKELKKASLLPPAVITSERLKPFQAQIEALNAVKTTIGLAAESLKKKEFR